MAKKYKVSLIIPIYNVEAYIEDSLTSALNQDFESIEYILIDDCGTDNSMGVVMSMLKEHPRRSDVYIYQQPTNCGLSEARNLGLRNVHGDYVFFMDSDDEITSDCISLHYEVITKSKADFTVANVKQVGAKSIHIKRIPESIDTNSPLASFFRREWSTSAWNKMFKTSFLNKHNMTFLKGIQHEDYLWTFSVAKSATSYAVVPQATYIYKIRKGSITTSTNGDLKITSMLHIIRTIRNDRYSRCQEGESFLSFIAFNTALYILNYKGAKKKNMYYKELQGVKITPPHAKSRYNIYHKLICLPFALFNILIKPIYMIYKILIS